MSKNLKSIAVLSIASALVFGSSAAAHAATDIYYAFGTPLAQGQRAVSGYGGVNQGGEGYMNATFGGKLYLRTYGDNSGYVYGGVDIPNHARVRFSHAPIGPTHAECWWDYGIQIPGTTGIDCIRTRQ